MQKNLLAKFKKSSKLLASPWAKVPLTPHQVLMDRWQTKHNWTGSYVSKGKNTATLVTGGKRKGSRGCFIEPTLFLNPEEDSPIWTEEIFGPVLTVKTFKTEEEAIGLANNSIFGLAGMLPLLVKVHMENHS